MIISSEKLRAALGALVLFCLAAAAQAGEAKALRGVALVIGQSDYLALPRLANPANDARAMDRLLTDLGFEVATVRDGDRQKLDRSLKRLVEDSAGADVVLVFYSGHGIEAGGEDFLIPVDAALPVGTSRTSHVDGLVPVSAALAELQRKVPVVIAILDACRTDPFPPGTLVRAPTGEAVAISAAGLAAPRSVVALAASSPAASNVASVIGFSAEPGRVAEDGAPGANSPYVAALLKHLAAGGFAFGDVMTMVTEEVYLATGGRQRPWTNTSLRRLLYFGTVAEEAGGDEALIRGERRKLLLTIADTPSATRSLVETIARDDSVPLDQLYGMFKLLDVDPDLRGDDLAAQLKSGAEKLRTILSERNAVAQADPDIIRLSSLADRAESEGAIEAALHFRSEASQRADSIAPALDEAEAGVKARRVELAQTYARNAETAVLAFDFATAAEKYGSAYDQARRYDAGLAYYYLLSRADALVDSGTYRGDKQALGQAVQTYRLALSNVPKGVPRLSLAGTQSNLGNALTVLGERENDPERLKAAVRAYNAALKVMTRRKAPEQWAGAQLNLGTAYMILGERGTGTTELKKAVSAFQAALGVLRQDAAPLDWAGTQNNLGNALSDLYERTGDAGLLDEAVAAFRAALEERTRARVPVDWAATQGNLAVTLRQLAIARNDPSLLDQALPAIKSELEVETREKMPFQWSGAQNNLANVLEEIGNRETGTASLEAAAAAMRNVAMFRTREEDPVNWAGSHYNLGRMLKTIGDRTGSVDTYRESVAEYRLAADQLERDGPPILRARQQSRMAEALAALGKATADPKPVEEARGLYRKAWDFWKSQGETHYDAYFQTQLAELDTAR